MQLHACEVGELFYERRSSIAGERFEAEGGTPRKYEHWGEPTFDQLLTNILSKFLNFSCFAKSRS